MSVPKVEIDKDSGFCAGVIAAISKAEQQLALKGGDDKNGSGENDRRIFSLGALVHNESELSRIENLGLITINPAELDTALTDSMPYKGDKLIIRAHGEPPETYRKAANLGFEIIDCTCPVVLKLQQSIKKAYEVQQSRGLGQIIIFGKPGHAEVLGLVGQTDGKAVVVENYGELEEKIATHEILIDVPTELFSQTTKSPDEYEQLSLKLQSILGDLLTVHNTICRQVASRHSKLEKFARERDVIIFVSGNESSNGKVLCNLCRRVNSRTYHISKVEQIKSEWFRPNDRIGVCGATSTPQWLLEKVAEQIRFILQLCN